MSLVRVIGVGSAQGDDQVGWVFVDQFESQASYDTALVDVVKCLTPATELFHLLHGVELVIIVDAVASDQAGKIYHLDQEELHLRQDFISSHGMDVVTALDLAKALHQLLEQLAIFGVGVLASSVGHQGLLSAEVEAALPDLIRLVEEQVYAVITKNNHLPKKNL